MKVANINFCQIFSKGRFASVALINQTGLRYILMNGMKLFMKTEKYYRIINPDEKHIRIDITDNGSGISEENIPHIFEPFFPQRRNQTVLIGIMIVYGIIQNHKGRIDVKPNRGKGTTISISLSLLKKQEDLKMAKNPILIVDDEESVRDSLYNWFIEDGYRVQCAEDAKKALSILESDAFDIILADIKMLGMDGLEMLRRIKSIRKESIVIMMTAFATVDTAVQALKDGAFDYVTKPFDPDDLSHLIRNASKQISLAEEMKFPGVFASKC
jgi:CheY-like chemotaxis protein